MEMPRPSGKRIPIKPILGAATPGSPATAAARLVLVDGKRKAQAARELGIDPAAVRRAVLRIQKTEKIVESLYV